MRNIFIGFLLIFLDFNVTAGQTVIGLIPDFIGYIVMINGLREMSEESPLFMKAKPFATTMAVYTGILYLFDLFGISVTLGGLAYLLAAVSTIFSLYISFNIVRGVKEMEGRYMTFLNGNSLNSTWTLLLVFSALSFVLLWLPPLAIISIIISFIVAIVFLVAFNRSKNLYYEMINR